MKKKLMYRRQRNQFKVYIRGKVCVGSGYPHWTMKGCRIKLLNRATQISKFFIDSFFCDAKSLNLCG